MRFTKPSIVSRILSKVTIICCVTMLLAAILVSLSNYISEEFTHDVALPTFILTGALVMLFGGLWACSDNVSTPIFDYFVFKRGNKICFMAEDLTQDVCITIGAEVRKNSDEEIEFESNGQIIKMACDKNVIEYLKKLGVKIE